MCLIVIVDEDNAIGDDLDIPMEVPKEERQLFRKLTLGLPTIMGRKTYDSIGHALPDRPNIVVSKSLTSLPDATVVSSIEEALQTAHSLASQTCIIGGATLYEYALEHNLADTLFISVVPGKHKANVFFPEFDKQAWRHVTIERFPSFTFHVYKKL